MKIIFTGGGTGGHAYPIETIYKEIEKNSIEDNKYLWIGSIDSIEEEIAGRNNLDFKAILTGKLRRYFSLNNILDIFKIPIGIIQSFFIIKKFKPQVIFSKGGFVSVPPVIAGWMLSVPILAHESDAIPGLANKIGAKFANKSLYGFEKTKKLVKTNAEKIYTGNLIAEDILNGNREAGIKYFDLDEGKKTILVIGGSQGATNINRAVIDSLEFLLKKYQIIHVSGKKNYKDVKQDIECKEIRKNYHLFSFLEPMEMGNALAVSDIVISRAGASAITEIAAHGKPSILVPLPKKGSRGDQIENAKYFKKAGAANIINDEDLDSEKLINLVADILDSDMKYQKISDRVSKISNISASPYIAGIILEYGYNNFNLNKLNRIHLVGIGGIGVSSLARIFVSQNIKVSGSDITESKITEDLRKIGIDITIGEKSSEFLNNEVDLLVYTVAAESDNPDIVKAKELNIRCLSYPQVLSLLTKEKFSICISGSHGKTSTTAITSIMMETAKLDPTVIVGSNVKQFDGNARLGKSKYLVLEADEYKRAFLKYYPNIIMLTSVEYEHPDIYRNLNDYLTTFKQYVSKLHDNNVLIFNNDDKNIIEIADYTHCKKVSYAVDNQADIQAVNIRYREGLPLFDVQYNNDAIKDIELKIPGKFNIYNALASIALGINIGISHDAIKVSLFKYIGSWRRFEIKGNNRGIEIVDDYAHHPTEVKATLTAARRKYPKSRIICVYQPHQKKRTKELYRNFFTVFDQADLTIITDIYEVAGREEDIDVSSKKLVKEIDKENIKYIGNLDEVNKYLQENIKENDVVITMGAGTITGLSDKLVNFINEK